MNMSPEARNILLELLVAAIGEIIRLVRHIISEIIGVQTIPVPGDTSQPAG